MGVVRNPRIFKCCPWALDLKRFWNGRPGLTGWVLFNWSYMSAQYFSCKITNEAVVCSETGDWSNVSYSMWIICLSQWWYILDYNMNEEAYLTTTDIKQELFGWMFTYGSMGFLPYYYSFVFSFYLTNLENPLHSPSRGLLCSLIFICAMTLFRVTNSTKR
eukprot:UN32799